MHCGKIMYNEVYLISNGSNNHVHVQIQVTTFELDFFLLFIKFNFTKFNLALQAIRLK